MSLFFIIFFFFFFEKKKKVPAHFKNSFNAETIRKGDNVKIACEAFGEEPITISWSKDRIPFQPIKETRYTLTEQASGHQASNSMQTSASIDVQQQQQTKDDSILLNSLSRLNALQALKSSNSYINILEINQTDRRDSALFTCIASNLYGKDEYNVQIIVQGMLFTSYSFTYLSHIVIECMCVSIFKTAFYVFTKY